ncbi:hypothetical protein H0S70_06140 [Chryseobacterium manosquense]|uniref:Uncharacterized protein n=1 Tax=Chryseobacterium manosquense TaxID=2754694 RepID=A0A7H1DZY2_9FLAO|nr:hypothetical protein [Chryseobacterium manosquense]QNS42540.1 hypothetical protein H0S70_06140 [Chryseobacterium manosquense]
MKYLLEIILTTIIIFFLWNILKRMFFSAFYKFPKSDENPKPKMQKPTAKVDSKINWDAETVEYEEIKENKQPEK